MCWEIVKNPEKALSNARKSMNINRTLVIMLKASIMFALALTVFMFKFIASPLVLLSIFLAILLGSYIALLFLGYVIRIIMRTLGGKGNFFEGLTSITYAFAVPAAGMLIAAIFSFIPYVGIVISFVFLVITLAYGMGMLYRGIKELYKVDMVTSLIAVSILTLTVIFSVWLIMAMGMASLGSWMPVMNFR